MKPDSLDLRRCGCLLDDRHDGHCAVHGMRHLSPAYRDRQQVVKIRLFLAERGMLWPSGARSDDPRRSATPTQGR